MLKPQYFQIIFVAIMAMVMSFVMAFAMTAINVGFVDDFTHLWLKAFLTGYAIAFPTALLVAPIARSLASMLTQSVKLSSK